MSTKIEAARQFLKTVLNIDEEMVLKQVFTSGTNRHFVVNVAGSQYFLKNFVTNSLQVVNREQQFYLQTQLAGEGVAVKPIALSPDHEFWLEEYIDCHHPFADAAGFEQLLAEILWQIHNYQPFVAHLDLRAEWQRYLSLAERHCDLSSRTANALFSAYNNEDEFCFCHNDLHYSHIVLTETVKVLDWEYAAIGNRYFDLAACCQVNQLSSAQTANLAARYAQLSDIPPDGVLSGIRRLKPVVDFTNELWHNAYNNLTKKPEDTKHYGYHDYIARKGNTAEG